MMKKKKSGNDYAKFARQSIAGGIMPVMGSGIIGSVAGATGASPAISGTAQAGMGLLATGNLARTGMGLASMFSSSKKKRRR